MKCTTVTRRSHATCNTHVFAPTRLRVRKPSDSIAGFPATDRATVASTNPLRSENYERFDPSQQQNILWIYSNYFVEYIQHVISIRQFLQTPTDWLELGRDRCVPHSPASISDRRSPDFEQMPALEVPDGALPKMVISSPPRTRSASRQLLFRGLACRRMNSRQTASTSDPE